MADNWIFINFSHSSADFSIFNEVVYYQTIGCGGIHHFAVGRDFSSVIIFYVLLTLFAIAKMTNVSDITKPKIDSLSILLSTVAFSRIKDCLEDLKRQSLILLFFWGNSMDSVMHNFRDILREIRCIMHDSNEVMHHSTELCTFLKIQEMKSQSSD